MTFQAADCGKAEAAVFILEEMTQLAARGFEIYPCALVRPGNHDPIHAKAEPFMERLSYRSAPGSAASAWDWLATCATSPKGGASATLVSLLHSLRAPSHSKELLGSLAAACRFARALRGQKIDHIHAQFGSMPATVGMLLAEITGLTFSISLLLAWF